MKYLKYINIYRKWTILFIFLVIFASFNIYFIQYALASSFNVLQKKLIADGFNKTKINHLYTNFKTSFNPNIIGNYFIHNESILNYQQFTNQNSIGNAKKYIVEHKEDLLKAEKKYGVDKEVITAILLIESRLGSFTGRQKVFNILSSMAALIEKEPRHDVWECISTKKTISKKNFEQKADKKSKWAYQELKSFLQYSEQENINPLDIKGSYAGAIGIAQFMPSNLILLGQDGNKNGTINLFEHSDAIYSVANYLKYYGWYPNIDYEKAKKTIRCYNNSSFYANTVMEITTFLKG